MSAAVLIQCLVGQWYWLPVASALVLAAVHMLSSESTQGKLFRAPSALTLARRRGASCAFTAAGIGGYPPLRECMLAIMASRSCAGELRDYSPLCRHSTLSGHSIDNTQDQLSFTLWVNNRKVTMFRALSMNACLQACCERWHSSIAPAFV